MEVEKSASTQIILRVPFNISWYTKFNMKKPRKFKFPISILNSINECTQGYFLVTVTSDREFEIYQNLNDTVDHMAVIHFLDVHAQVMKDAVLHQAAKQFGKTEAGNNGENLDRS